MASSFKIPKIAYGGFDALIEIGPERLDRLTKEVAELDLTLDTSELAKRLSKAIDFSSDRIELAIHTVLIPLNSLRADFRISASEFLRLLSKMFAQQNEEWHKKNENGWVGVVQKLEPFLAPNGYFSLLSKTFQLLANRPTVAQNLKILTELRPVFDDELSKTKAMVLTSTLVVEYEEGEVSKSLHLTVDQSDLQALQEQLDRTDKKILLLEEQAGKLGVPVLIAGTERE